MSYLQYDITDEKQFQETRHMMAVNNPQESISVSTGDIIGWTAARMSISLT